jgi:anti-sigma factor RsiW
VEPDREAERAGGFAAGGFHIGKGFVAIHRRLAFAEQVEVRAVQDESGLGHVWFLPAAAAANVFVALVEAPLTATWTNWLNHVNDYSAALEGNVWRGPKSSQCPKRRVARREESGVI